jgi:tRNA threonylcarbamoyladenosine biosynthesis protein TsaB
MNILAIDSSGTYCSVSLQTDTDMIITRNSGEPNSHSSHLTLLIQDLLDSAGIKCEDLNAVAVSSGPGSYTGLRIGVSVAKGICFSCSVPLIAIPTIESLALWFIESRRTNFTLGDLIMPMLDARRMEVYTALFDASGKRLMEDSAVVLTNDRNWDGADRIHIFGDGAKKCKEAYPNAKILEYSEGIYPHSLYILSLAGKYYTQSKFVDTAYFEPNYLKAYDAKKGVNPLDLIRS